MLEAPNKQVKKCLDHADFLDQLEPERFSMRTWGLLKEPRCICGWLMHNEGCIDKDDWESAGKMLGMDRETASHFFTQPLPPTLRDDITNREAARALRHYAVTGEFKGW